MTIRLFAALAVAAAVVAVVLPRAVSAGPADEPASVLAFKVNDIDGKPVDLATFKGNVLLIVNTASQCGNTPQYAGLEALYNKNKGQGFAVLAFPANDFGRQEPGSDSEIKQFCSSRYNVTFPLFSKITVKGAGIHPLYKYLTTRDTKPVPAGDIGWNFDKFLVNRKGEVIARFKAGEKPDAPKLVAAIEAALAEAK